MKIENTNLSPLNTPDQSSRNRVLRTAPNPGVDDVHFSELVRSLRSLAADSPERQERLEQIARSYANGTYKVDAEATASGIIESSRRYR